MSLNSHLSQLVPLGKARRELIPRAASGRPIAPATIWRWHRKGLLTPSGERIRLEIVLVGSRPYVSPTALEEFFSALTAAHKSADPSDVDTAALDAQRERRLRAAGLL